MWLELPEVWVWVLNILGWPVIHLSVSYWATRLSAESFNDQNFWFRIRRWEHGGEIYEKLFGVRAWKEKLPDGAKIFAGGFPKKRITSSGVEYLKRFSQETCRGELAHWVTLAFAPLFFLWNPLWADLVMVSYALLANLPCIIVQRFNRARLAKLLAHS